SRSRHQYSYHWADSAGGTKNSISICSNSRVRKIQFWGVISLRKLLPIWAMPKGGFLRVVCTTLAKFTNMPCAVSGRRYATVVLFSTGLAYVLNMRLNWRASVKLSLAPQLGHVWGSSSLSSRKRWRHALQSTSGSVKFRRWPDASHTAGGDRMAASSPTTSLRSCTIERHQ